MEIWALALTDVCGRIDELLPGAPPSLEPESQNTFDLGGTQDRDRNPSGRETEQMWPALVEMYTSYYQERGRYRTGGRELSPELKLPQTTSLKEQWLEANEARRPEKRMGKLKWATQSDSAIQVMGGRATGNVLPTTRQAYQALKRQAVHTFQLLARGGMMGRNWLVMEMKSEEWGENMDEPRGDINSHVKRGNGRVPGVRVGTPAEDNLPGEPLSASYHILRRGAREDPRRGAQGAY